MLRPIFAAFFIWPLLAPATASADPNSTSWSWPWSRQSSRPGQTILHPNPQPEILRDHKRAEDQLRRDWLREKRQIEQKHRAALQEYVDTRLALAVEQVRTEKLRKQQAAELARRNAIMQFSSDEAGGTGPGRGTPQGASVLTAWWPTKTTNRPTPSTPSSFVEPVRQAANEVTRRTREIWNGNDDLVKSNKAYGLPQGVAVFLALLMMHVPSVAVASLFIGVAMIRSHRTHLGAVFLSLAGILAIIIFFTIPW